MLPLLAGIGPLGVPELLIIAFIIVLVFGVGRLPEVGGAVGRGLREFRKASKDDDNSPGSDASSAASTDAADDTVYCRECGAANPNSSKFCASCGKTIQAAVS